MKRLYNNKTGAQVRLSGTAAAPYVQYPNGVRYYFLATAITSGVTAKPTGSNTGDFAVTSHATGKGKLFSNDGTHLAVVGDGSVTPATHVADVTTVNGSDPTTTQALANANKAKINEILAALQAAGLMA
jgi:uncharacterized protein YggE